MATPAVLPQRHPARAADIWPNPARPTCCPGPAGGTALVTHQFETNSSWIIRLRAGRCASNSVYLACSRKLVVCRGMCSNVVLVITLGIILLIVGFLIHSPILWAIGILLLVIGAILALLGALGRAVFGRRHYW